MIQNGRHEAEVLSSHLDELLASPLSGQSTTSELAADLSHFSWLVVESERNVALEVSTRRRLWERAEQLAASQPADDDRANDQLGRLIRCVWRSPLGLPRWTGAIAASLVAVGLVGTVGATMLPLLNQVWRSEAGRNAVMETLLTRELNLAETKDGVTISVKEAYADANRIVIGYSLQLPDSLRDRRGVTATEGIVLTDSEGRTYHPVYGLAGTVGSQNAGTLGAEVLSFDSSSLPQGVGPVSFELTIAQVVGKRIIREGASKDEVLARGPWKFRFMLSVLPGRVVEPHQSVTAAGVTILLERVVVTPSETRAHFRFNAPAQQPRQRWSLAALLDAPGASPELGNSLERPPGSGQWEARFLTPPAKADGEWTFRVTELIALLPPTSSGQIAKDTASRIPGPWEFRFRVP